MLIRIRAWLVRHEKGLRRAKNIILIVIGALLSADTLFASMILPGNIGAYLPAVIGLPLLLLGGLDAPLRRFSGSNGAGC